MKARKTATFPYYDNGIYQHGTYSEFSLVCKDKNGCFHTVRACLYEDDFNEWRCQAQFWERCFDGDFKFLDALDLHQKQSPANSVLYFMEKYACKKYA